MNDQRIMTGPEVGKNPDLQQFLAILTPVTLGFALMLCGAAVLFHDGRVGLAGGLLASYGCLLLWTRAMVRQNRRQQAVLLICNGLLVATLLMVLVEPGWVPILIVTPLLGVTVALPYIADRVLLRLIVLAWAVSLIVTMLGEVLPMHTTLPGWFGSSVRISAVGASVGSMLLLLWQFSSRLTKTLAQTRAAEERYALAAQGVNDGLWDWDFVTNQIYFSPRWKRMLGYSEEVIGTHPDGWLVRIHPDDQVSVRAALASHQAGQTAQFESEHRMLHQNGHHLWVLSRGVAIRDEKGVAVRMAGSQSDISARKQVEAQLSHSAMHDPLTGLPNRALFTQRVMDALARAQRQRNYQFAVLFLDLDGFKLVNDSLGHAIGDQLLIGIARRLEACLRPGDTVARQGGDEFTVLLEGLPHGGVPMEIAERIQAALIPPFILGDHEFFTTISIGIALSRPQYTQPEDLLRDADTAMYRAKDAGKGRHAMFDPGMHLQALARLHLEADLRRALARQEFVLHYQPIVSLAMGRIVGFEALVRWQHPERGLLQPREFIASAQDLGMMELLGDWILRAACQQMQRWQTAFPSYQPLTVNVNCTSIQCVQPGFTEQLAALLDELGLSGRQVRVEITESVLMEYNEVASRVLAQLRNLAVDVHLDDFGTGYSSLSMLHRFPIDVLKIDQSFIKRLGTDRDSAEVVQTIVTLAHTLGMDVTAEGVETASQLDELRTCGCDFGQGYFFSPPVDEVTATALLTAEPRWSDLGAATRNGQGMLWDEEAPASSVGLLPGNGRS